MFLPISNQKTTGVFNTTVFCPAPYYELMDWPSADSTDLGAPSVAPTQWRVHGRVMCHLVESHVRAVQHQYAYAAHVDLTYAGLPPDELAAGVTPTAAAPVGAAPVGAAPAATAPPPAPLIPAGYFAAPRAEGRVLFVAPDRGPEFDACIAAARGQLCLVLHQARPAAAGGNTRSVPQTEVAICGTLSGPPEAIECAVAGARQVLTAPPLTVLRRRDYSSDGARICDVELSRGSYDLMRGAPGLIEGREVRGVGRHLSAEDRMLCYTLLSPAADTAVCLAYDELVDLPAVAGAALCPGLIRCHLIGPAAFVDQALAWAQKRYKM